MRRRILAAMMLVTALAVALFAVPLGVTTRDIYRSHEVGRLEHHATRLLGTLPPNGLETPPPLALPPTPTGWEVGVYDRAGRRLAGTGPTTADRVARFALGGSVYDVHAGDQLAAAIPVHDETQVVGAIRVAEPWHVVSDAARRRWLLMLAVGLAAIAGAAALGAALARRLARPIDDMVTVAVRLGEGDFGSRVAPSGVPELDRAGTALNRTAAHLDTLLTRERSFSADAAHQLNTPLTSLRLGLESALLTPGADHDTAIQAAISEVDRLQATVDTLLAVARDGPDPDAATDLPALCRDVIAQLRRDTPAIATTGRRIELDAGIAVPAVRCSADVLREILAVLLDNALTHGAGTVTVTLRRRGDGATLAVSDQGPGIPAHHLDQIFARRNGTATGHGIGLGLARRLAQAHSLRLELTHPAPHPTFTLALPGAPDSPVNEAVPGRRPRPLGAEPAGG